MNCGEFVNYSEYILACCYVRAEKELNWCSYNYKRAAVRLAAWELFNEHMDFLYTQTRK